eukprot:TRINITY_DN1476_c0_g4_i1.p1 TRINITY_DN1476_c0_g4~~TRINITY_DN1476_c0_g4_i1.p1  ORF type:complete len:403 (-),score=140.97 TRINITY_DN1476_c0_g4_i1:102-1310(-)
MATVVNKNTIELELELDLELELELEPESDISSINQTDKNENKNKNQTNDIEIINDIESVNDYRTKAIARTATKLQRQRSSLSSISKHLSRTLSNQFKEIFIINSQEKRDCSICLEQLPVSQIYTLINCMHQFCRQCILDYLNVQILEKKVIKINCPDKTCNKDLEYVEIKELIDPTLFAKYEDFQLQVLLESEKFTRWCPKQRCGFAVTVDETTNHIKCPRCAYEYCFTCGNAAHPSITCEEYAQWQAENGNADQEYATWALIHTKKCPNCLAAIEKNSGCNHITCLRCNYEFCWLCMERYNTGHYNDGPCDGKQFYKDENEKMIEESNSNRNGGVPNPDGTFIPPHLRMEDIIPPHLMIDQQPDNCIGRNYIYCLSLAYSFCCCCVPQVCELYRKISARHH